jgi:hypothetical protein
MHRRDLLASGVAAGALGLAPWARAQTPAGDAALTAAFDRVFADTVKASPTLATQLGLDKGANAALKRQLDDNGPGAIPDALARNRRHRAEVAAVAPGRLSAQAKIDREVILYNIDQQIVGPERFGVASPQRPYRITQQGGAYFGLPDFLNSQHAIAARRMRRPISTAWRWSVASSITTPPPSVQTPRRAGLRPISRSTSRSIRWPSCARPRRARTR